MTVKIERIPPGKTNNPDHGILPTEKIKTKTIMEAISSIPDTPIVKYKKAKPYCTCLEVIRIDEEKKNSGKSVKNVNHKRYELTEVDQDDNCIYCGYPAHFYCIHPQNVKRINGVKRSI